MEMQQRDCEIVNDIMRKDERSLDSSLEMLVDDLYRMKCVERGVLKGRNIEP